MQNPLCNLRYGVILGSTSFQELVRGKLSLTKPDSEVGYAKDLCFQVELAMIRSLIAKTFGLTEDRLCVKGKNVARDAALYLAHRWSGKKLPVIADYFGGGTAASVSMACRRTHQRMDPEKSFCDLVKMLEHQLAGLD